LQRFRKQPVFVLLALDRDRSQERQSLPSRLASMLWSPSIHWRCVQRKGPCATVLDEVKFSLST